MKEKLDLIEKNNELIKTIEKLKEEKDSLVEKERKRIEGDKLKYSNLNKKYDSVQEELMKSQIKYQKEIEKLEKENRELRKQLMLKAGQALKVTSIKKSLIDMYSEVLDELSGYDSSYNTANRRAFSSDEPLQDCSLDRLPESLIQSWLKTVQVIMYKVKKGVSSHSYCAVFRCWTLLYWPCLPLFSNVQYSSYVDDSMT